jgi:hypothetical protein
LPWLAGALRAPPTPSNIAEAAGALRAPPTTSNIAEAGGRAARAADDEQPSGYRR